MAYGAKETISGSRPVISFELREDKPVSAEMIAALEVPKHVATFQLLKFCVQMLNYTVFTPPGAGRGDLMLIPAEIAASRGLGPGLPLDLVAFDNPSTAITTMPEHDKPNINKYSLLQLQ